MSASPRSARRALAFASATALLALAPLAAAAATTPLYDPALGSLPSAQGWLALATGAAAGRQVGGGVYTVDTTGAGVEKSVIGQFGQLLDTQAGFNLNFSLQLLSETHTNPHRAGYSLVLVGAQANHALELDFWADHIWAQRFDASQPDHFVHDIDVAFDTTAALTTYTLAVRQQQFTLSAGGTALLTGALRDYTAGGWPYTMPNALFLGDNSSRGQSISRLGEVSLSPVPEPAAALLLVLGLATGLAVPALRRR